MNKGIAIAGNVLVDNIKIISAYPNQGMLINISAFSRAVGGCVCNTGISLARLDENVKITAIGIVGNDTEGGFIKETMKENGIDISMVKTVEGNSSFTDVMTAQDTNERTFFYATGVSAEFGPFDIDYKKIDADILHIGYALLLDKMDSPDETYGTQFAKALKFAKDAGLKTSMDVVSEHSDRFSRLVTPCLKYCDYIVLNEIESGNVCGIEARNSEGKLNVENIKLICHEFFKRGVGEKVVIHAPEGGFCMDNNGNFVAVPSLLLPSGYIKGTVGAGDAFCAGILYSLYMGFDDEYALRLASCAAACNLSSKDSISGARNVADTMKLEQEYGKREL